jgi:IS30 family transposase
MPVCRSVLEHANRLVRQYFPKGTRIDDISHAAVARAEPQLNGPRKEKRLGYRTPREMLLEPASEAMLG